MSRNGACAWCFSHMAGRQRSFDIQLVNPEWAHIFSHVLKSQECKQYTPISSLKHFYSRVAAASRSRYINRGLQEGKKYTQGSEFATRAVITIQGQVDK